MITKKKHIKTELSNSGKPQHNAADSTSNATISSPLVISTRPGDQNESWQQRLTASGFHSVVQPLLEIKKLTDFEHVQKIKQTVLNLDQYQKILFVSQNAVRFGLSVVEEYWPECPSGITWFAVGSKTAEVLERELQGLNCFSKVNVEREIMNSESLLAIPELEKVRGDKILIARGLGGRPHLSDVLVERGAAVHFLELYERRKPDNLEKKYLDLFVKYSQHCVSGWVFSLFSGETLENFNEVIEYLIDSFADPETSFSQAVLGMKKNEYDNTIKKVQKIKKESWVLVPGHRVRDLALENGFEKVICADNASENSMISALTSGLREKL